MMQALVLALPGLLRSVVANGGDVGEFGRCAVVDAELAVVEGELAATGLAALEHDVEGLIGGQGGDGGEVDFHLAGVGGLDDHGGAVGFHNLAADAVAVGRA
jgi:hypothetical protein